MEVVRKQQHQQQAAGSNRHTKSFFGGGPWLKTSMQVAQNYRGANAHDVKHILCDFEPSNPYGQCSVPKWLFSVYKSPLACVYEGPPVFVSPQLCVLLLHVYVTPPIVYITPPLYTLPPPPTCLYSSPLVFAIPPFVVVMKGV